MNLKTSLTILLASFFMTSGCAAVAPLGAGLTGMTMLEERTIGAKTDDNIIIAKIKVELSRSSESSLLTKISVNSYEGRVMLTGDLKEQEQVDEAVRCAWSIFGVKEVINELVVAPSPQNKVKDLWISAKIKGHFLVEKDFNSLNYKYDVNDGVVYLLGVAQNDKELDTALKIVGEVDGVTKVVSHVVLKTDWRRSNQS